MSNLLIRNVDPETFADLKAEAERNGRSVQAEVVRMLKHALDLRRLDRSAWDEMDRLRALTDATEQTDSAELIRADRDSDYGRLE